jgi:formylglycine-generating enzyme required for sulfatase activity
MLFFELLTGTRAVNGDTIEAVLYQILNVPLDPAPLVNAGAPPQVRALVLRCVEKKPEDRPQSFGVVVSELRALISGSTGERTQPVVSKTMPLPSNALPEVNAPQKRSPAIWLVPLVLLLLIGAGSAWWIAHRTAPPQKTSIVEEPPPKKQPAPIRGMVYIPAGSFLSGKENTPISLPAFYIDETEVSNADFSEYCHASGCAAPLGAQDLPVVNVTATQAREYAAWKGKRLPNTLEWERAARGTEGAKYPWGDAADKSLANVGGAALKRVKSYEPYRGLYQMTGNAWEMVDGKIDPSPQALKIFSSLKPPATAQEPWIAMRGGSFHTKVEDAVAWEFAAIPERFSSIDIGFRCAKSAP